MQIGDLVRIVSYKIGRLYPNPIDDPEVVGQLALVVRTDAECKRYFLRLVDKPRTAYTEIYDVYTHLELIERGKSIVPGIDYPMTDSEWNDVILEDLAWKYDRLNFRHQGFSNYPTFLAHLYLNNESSFVNNVQHLWRKDGTINPDKIQKEFNRLKLKIEPEAFYIPMDFPSTHAYLESRWAPRVNWKEVADCFARTNK